MNTIFSKPGAYVKSWIAELIGTFLLMLLVLLAPPSLTFAAAGAMLLVLVVAIGNVSGAHVNPAVTAGLIAAGKFPPIDGLVYVVAQILGSGIAVGLVKVLGRALPSVDPGENAFAFEFLGAFLLVFVVTQVTVKGVPEAGSALAVGIALGLGALLAGPNSGGVLNPALGFTMLFTGLIERPLSSLAPYLIGPLLGGVLAGLLGTYLGTGQKPEVQEEPTEDQESTEDAEADPA